MVPFPLLLFCRADLHTSQIQFCLEEWQTGARVQAKLNESDLAIKYQGHLKVTEEWDNMVPEVTGNIRRKIYKDLRYVTGDDSHLNVP